MLCDSFMADKLEELPIYSKAKEFTVAVIAILRRPGLIKDCDLHKQIEEANDSIVSNMEEGFESSSDVDFARFLHYSKGSLAEVMGRLRLAREKGYIQESDVSGLDQMAEPLGKMLGGFIRYLQTSGFKNRGSYKNSARGRMSSRRTNRRTK
jgi:four helix bundle protein